jgi:hypothetical protein
MWLKIETGGGILRMNLWVLYKAGNFLITAGVLVSQEGLCMFPRLVQIQNFVSIFINSGYSLNQIPYQYATLHEILE